ncbi:hypothetical protein TNIN_377701 [Trichonephila inaurata madagascariensis]|uniref:Uncharacterized protein n=1 Tax=Trichonephila inaurata madagascariensis TaxID=2747483 RepID=A0A8X6YDZ2_9ARAC|nr:hypothetical protein TNIN_377701 [Trichonephila inaurata madagascariensis]
MIRRKKAPFSSARRSPSKKQSAHGLPGVHNGEKPQGRRERRKTAARRLKDNERTDFEFDSSIFLLSGVGLPEWDRNPIQYGNIQVNSTSKMMFISENKRRAVSP